MFIHVFIYRLKYLFRDKQLVFWTLMFPIILATLFNMAFSNIAKQEVFKKINVAIVDNAAYQQNESFKGAIADTEHSQLFQITVTSKSEAEVLLKNNKIAGYIHLEKGIQLTVKESGLEQTIIKGFLDDYNQTSASMATIMKNDPKALQNGLIESLSKRQEYLKSIPVSEATPDTTLNYFYSLIAMACLFGGFWGMKEITDIQADLSPLGIRINVAPVHKLKILIYDLLAALLIQFAEMIIVLLYLVLVLKIDFGHQVPYILLACFTGSVTGITMGTFISAVVKKGEGIKVAVLLGVTMTLSVFAGMMFVDMKYIISDSVPILGVLNPATLITDAFYSLYYYDTHSKFFTNIGILYGFSAVFCLITYLILRRQKYASL